LPDLVPGPPVAGAAEGFLRLPVGTPLSGYTGRCTCLIADAVDDRQSQYNTAFVESVGVQTMPTIKALWLENGDDHLVITKTDSIYSFDGLVDALEEQLGAATGLDLSGRVVHTTNHSHASWGTFSDQAAFYLGSDGYNEENFQRMAEQIAAVALQAQAVREPVALGLMWTDDWDPAHRVTHDRRPENDALVVWDDEGPEQGGRDDRLGLLRVDALDGRPLAVMVNFGMHGTVLDEDNPLASSESGGAVEVAFEETFDTPVVVMFTQGAGGDQSPGGEQDDFAHVESVGEVAAPLLRAVWEATPVGSDPITLETASRSIPQLPHEIAVRRGGAVDWRYLPFEEGRVPDNLVYADDGSLLSPFDEFNTDFGAAFCGTGDLDLPVGRLGVEVFPYSNCLEVELISTLVQVFFRLPPGEPPLPLTETRKAGTTASRFGPLTTVRPDGTSTSQDLLVGFFPGEPTAMFVKQWRRRAEAELGTVDAMVVGYAQDHEGYLLIPEDWLVGGYEPDIGVWGPLQGEHIMEGVLSMAGDVLGTDVREDPDPDGIYARPDWPDKPLPATSIDPTPEAGTALTDLPEEFYLPLGMTADLVVPAAVPRVAGIVQIAWFGGDPAVDSPRVVLERDEGAGFSEVLSASGRPITSDQADILVAWTPDPLYPVDGPQQHRWWAAWQAVGHVLDRAGLPLGTYRLRVTGVRWTGTEATWPWTTEPYEVVGAPFEVVAGALTVDVEGGLTASLDAPADGFRLVALGGDDRGPNPLVGPVRVVVASATAPFDGDVVPEAYAGRSLLSVSLPDDWTRVDVTDAYGNTGWRER
jgi:neutral ceramidase